MALFRYSRWDGTQQVFEPRPDEVLDELSNELTAHGDVLRALRRLFQNGMRGQTGQRVEGLRDLSKRLQQRRKDILQRHNLDTLMDDLRQRVDQIVKTEREGIQRRLDEARPPSAASDQPAAPQERQPSQQGQSGKQDAGQSPDDNLRRMLESMAQKKLRALDDLPKDMAGAIKQLQDYDFMDPEARRQFQELMDMLRRRMMDNVFKDLSQRVRGMSPEQMARMREMLRDLNQMLRDRLSGDKPDFQKFMNKHGQFFGPEPPQDMDELVEWLQRQRAQAQSLLNSMSPEQRQELQDMLEGMMDEDTRAEMAQMASMLDRLYPPDEMAQEYPFSGQESVTLDQAMHLMDQLQKMDDLERQMGAAMRSGNLDDVDPNKLEEQLGEDGRRVLDQLKQIAKQLEEAGYLQRKGDKLELTPKGMRRIGDKALRDIFVQLRQARAGRHDLFKLGAYGDKDETTKRYEFGDRFDIHLQRTLMNALRRERAGVPVALKPDDFEVHRAENLTRCATVLLLDQSRSMGYMGSFQAAKRVTLALYSLIETAFPTDSLYILGFSEYAHEIKKGELPETTWNAWMPGTNIHHALMLSRQLLARHKGQTRQVILITDGEPTAHLENGEAYFGYPPSHETIRETLLEVRRCTQEGIVINTFMLESSYYLMDFINQVTRINKGRAFYTTPDKLGQYILVDYLSHRRKRIG